MIGTYLPPKQMHLEAPVQEQDEPAQEVELAIAQPIQPFLRDMLTTAPADVQHFNLTFVRNELLPIFQTPVEDTQVSRDPTILELAKTGGIMPGHLRLRYNNPAGRVYRYGEEYRDPVFALNGVDENLYFQLFEAILKAKMLKISYSTRRDDFWGNGYANLVGEHLPRLTDNGYSLLSGDVTLTQNHRDDPVSDLRLREVLSPNTLLLVNRPNWSTYEPDQKAYERQNEFRTWFKELAGKHELPVEVHSETHFR